MDVGDDDDTIQEQSMQTIESISMTVCTPAIEQWSTTIEYAVDHEQVAAHSIQTDLQFTAPNTIEKRNPTIDKYERPERVKSVQLWALSYNQLHGPFSSELKT